MDRLEIDDKVLRACAQADSGSFSPEVYREAGFFVLRGVVSQDQLRFWQDEWATFYARSLDGKRKVDPFNPVNVHEAAPETLAQMHAHPAILDVMERLYPDLALFMQRFVIKDSGSRKPVFVHSDFGYDYGWPEKTTVFIPLSPSNEKNGGISFYPGTHFFGYMGDVGEANTDILSPDWPLVCPDLEPGDIALCHTCTWHCSPAFVDGPDRILVQATYQPADDPSSTVLLRGRWRVRFRLSDVPRDRFFVRCRSSRLRELQAEVDRLKVREEVAAS